MDTLVFQEMPTFEIAGNKFVNTPVVLRYEDIPLIRVVKSVAAGYTTEIDIYHSDGTILAKVKGAQAYPMEDGKKAGIVMRYPPGMTVCELNGRTVFELTRKGAAALKGAAELYTPDGSFIKASDSGLGGYVFDQMNKSQLQLGSMTFKNCTFEGGGLYVMKDGRCGFGSAAENKELKRQLRNSLHTPAL